MIKKYSNKFCVVFVGVICILFHIVFFPPTFTISNSYAQEKTADIGVDRIKALLFKQELWIGEWECWGLGILHEFIFEDRGKKIIVKINNPFDDGSCERDVKIKSDGFIMSACSMGITELFYDPNDDMYPFKTKGDNQECDLKVRHYNPETDFLR